MRKILVFLVSIYSCVAFAEDCSVERVYHPESHEFQACNITTVTPTYKLEVVRGGPHFGESDCNNFCRDYTLLPLRYGPVRVVSVVPRDFVNELLEFRTQRQIEIPPEVFLIRVMSTSLSMLGPVDGVPAHILQQSLQSVIHQRDAAKVLTEEYYTRLSSHDLSEDDRDPEKGAKCSICMESISAQMQKGEDVVRVNCNAKGCDFCKSCIEEQYHYNQNCPNCKQEIKPRSSSS